MNCDKKKEDITETVAMKNTVNWKITKEQEFLGLELFPLEKEKKNDQ